MFYILKGWVKFNYEGVGEVKCSAGTYVHQPPGIRHTELDHSDGAEVLDIVLPADFRTVDDRCVCEPLVTRLGAGKIYRLGKKAMEVRLEPRVV
jgi:hypothetical protein